jgi:hypothetical protein
MLVDRFHLKYPVIAEMIDDMELSGSMPPVHEGSFSGYAHTPAQLGREVKKARLALESLVALEGIAFALSDLDERLDDPEEMALLLGVLRAVETVPDLVGVGPHLLATGRKQ